MKLNFKKFALITLNLKNILADRVFTYCFIIPYQSPVGEIIYPSDGVKYVKAPLSRSLWVIASNGYRWVHTDGIITTHPDSSPSHIMTTLYTAKVYLPVIFSLSRNCNGCFLGVDDRWISWYVFQILSTTTYGIQATYCTYFREKRFSYERQQNCFHPNSVAVSRLLCSQFLKSIFSNPS